MRNIVLKIAYDGTDYCGWQRQPNAISVQQRIEQALSRLLNEQTTITGAGRTDSGVHAAAAFASFQTAKPLPIERLAEAANRLLPADIRIIAAYEVPLEFHPRKSPHHKTYVYSLALNEPSLFASRFCLYEEQRLDIEAMRAVAEDFAGSHDFVNFCLSGSSAQTTVRSIDSIELKRRPAYTGEVLWGNTPELLQIEVRAGGFLYKMVRLIASALLQVGKGELSREELRQMLEAKSCRPLPPLPPQGLMLKSIVYDEFEEFFTKKSE